MVPTRNSSQYLAECLSSIRAQTYAAVELIIINNRSDNGTVEHRALLCRCHLHCWPRAIGPSERWSPRPLARTSFVSTRTFAWSRRSSPSASSTCGEGNMPWWSTTRLTPWSAAWPGCASLRLICTSTLLSHTAARFLARDVFFAVGGLREDVTAGEDYDFQNRLRRAGVLTVFADAEAVHLDPPTWLGPVLRKYFRYGRDFPNYRRYNGIESKRQLSFIIE